MAEHEQAKQVAMAFCEHYYPNFCQNKDALANLYGDASTLLFEGQLCVGQAAIMAKLKGLSFQQIAHKLTNVDAVSVANGTSPNKPAILLTVLGQLKTDDDPPHSFTQTFFIRTAENESMYIAYEAFRMVLHN